MAKYHIQNVQNISGVDRIIFYQGNKHWTTEYEHRKVYPIKAAAESEIYDFGGMLVKDSSYIPE